MKGEREAANHDGKDVCWHPNLPSRFRNCTHSSTTPINTSFWHKLCYVLLKVLQTVYFLASILLIAVNTARVH